MKPTRRRIGQWLAAAPLGPGMTSACSNLTDQSAGRRLTLGHALSADHPVHKAMLYMKARLLELSSGEMTIDVYPSGQLGSERQLIELVQIGSVSMTKVSTLSLEGFLASMKLFSIPYLFDDEDHLWRVLGAPVGRDILNSLRPIRLQGLGYYNAGSRSFYMRDRAVHTPDDLAGLKIRVMSSRMAINMVEALGGSATPISWGELYTALQQGVVDGAENNLPSYVLSRHHETAPFLTLDEHTSVPDLIVISRSVFDDLSREERDWLEEAMADSVVHQKELWAQATNDAREEAVASGVKIIYPDKAPFQAAVSDILNQQRKTAIGPYISAVDQLRRSA